MVQVARQVIVPEKVIPGKPFTIQVEKPKKSWIENAWRIFSNRPSGELFMGIVQGLGELNVLASTADTDKEAAEGFGCCCNPCSEIFTDLYFDIYASHGCNRAHFDIYILDYKTTNEAIYQDAKYWIYCGHANINTGKENLVNSPNNGNAPDTLNYDYFTIPESLLAEANQDKTEEQCCNLEFLCYPSPWPSRLFLTNEYQLITEENFSFRENSRDQTYYIKSIDNVQLDQRELQDVHTSIATVTLRTPRGDATSCIQAGPPQSPFHQTLARGEISAIDGCCTLQKNTGYGIGGVTVNLCAECEPENTTDPCQCWHEFVEVVATVNLSSATWYSQSNNLNTMNQFGDALVDLFSGLEIPMGFFAQPSVAYYPGALAHESFGQGCVPMNGATLVDSKSILQQHPITANWGTVAVGTMLRASYSCTEDTFTVNGNLLAAPHCTPAFHTTVNMIGGEVTYKNIPSLQIGGIGGSNVNSASSKFSMRNPEETDPDKKNSLICKPGTTITKTNEIFTDTEGFNLTTFAKVTSPWTGQSYTEAYYAIQGTLTLKVKMGPLPTF